MNLFSPEFPPGYSNTPELDCAKEKLKIAKNDDRQHFATQILSLAREAMPVYSNKALSALVVAGRHASGKLKQEIVDAIRACAKDPRIDNDAKEWAGRAADLYDPQMYMSHGLPPFAPEFLTWDSAFTR